MILTVIDIETTGLDRNVNDIIQFAYMITNMEGQILKSEVLHFYQPEFRENWTEAAQAVHGIRVEDLIPFQDDFDTNCRKMYTVLYRANVVSYNGEKFDVPFIGDWLTRYGYTFVNDAEPINHFDVYKIMQEHRMRCKLTEAPAKLGLNERLIQLLTKDAFKESSIGPHDAGYDVMATHLCFKTLVDKGLFKFDTGAADDVDTSMNDEETTIGDTYFYIHDESGLKKLRLCSNVADTAMFIEYTDDTPEMVFEKVDTDAYAYGRYLIRVGKRDIVFERRS